MGLRHEPLAYQERPVAQPPEPLHVVRALEPAFADRDDRRRNAGDQRFRGGGADFERPQIAVVDADDPGAGVERNLELGGVMDLDEHVELERGRMIVQHFQFDRPERADDQQHRVGSGRFRLQQLVFRDDEVLSQDRDVDDGADALQMLERAVEKRRLREYRNRRRSGRGVFSGDVLRHVRVAEHPARRRAALALGNHIHAVDLLQRGEESPRPAGDCRRALLELGSGFLRLAHLDDSPRGSKNGREQIRRGTLVAVTRHLRRRRLPPTRPRRAGPACGRHPGCQSPSPPARCLRRPTGCGRR